jgi:hypothetical protein
MVQVFIIARASWYSGFFWYSKILPKDCLRWFCSWLVRDAGDLLQEKRAKAWEVE